MNNSQKAFTLIELMVTVVIFGILAAMAFPSFNAAIVNNRSAALAEDFVTEVNYARYEAVKRAKFVTICASDDGINCSGSWADGFITFVDDFVSTDESTPIIHLDASNVKEILRQWNRSDPRTNITVTKNAADIGFVRYTNLGTLALVGGNQEVVITTKIDGCSGSSARKLKIGLSGLISVSNSACE